MIRDMNYELFMGEALAVARQAAERGAPPVGAIAVMNEAMVARGANRVAEKNDPTAHAVVVALREASRKLGTHAPLRRDDLHHPRAVPDVRRRAARVGRRGARVRGAQPGRRRRRLGPPAGPAPGLARRLQVVSGIRAEEAAELTADREAVAAGA